MGIVAKLLSIETGRYILVAGVLGIGIGGLGLLIKRKEQEVLEKSPFLIVARKIIQNQPEVKDLLGENIRFGHPSMDRKKAIISATEIKSFAPIKGDKDKGSIYFQASRPNEEQKFKLKRLEISFNKVKGKRLVIYDRDACDSVEVNITKDDSKIGAQK